MMNRRVSRPFALLIVMLILVFLIPDAGAVAASGSGKPIEIYGMSQQDLDGDKAAGCHDH